MLDTRYALVDKLLGIRVGDVFAASYLRARITSAKNIDNDLYLQRPVQRVVQNHDRRHGARLLATCFPGYGPEKHRNKDVRGCIG